LYGKKETPRENRQTKEDPGKQLEMEQLKDSLARDVATNVTTKEKKEKAREQEQKELLTIDEFIAKYESLLSTDYDAYHTAITRVVCNDDPDTKDELSDKLWDIGKNYLGTDNAQDYAYSIIDLTTGRNLNYKEGQKEGEVDEKQKKLYRKLQEKSLKQIDAVIKKTPTILIAAMQAAEGNGNTSTFDSLSKKMQSFQVDDVEFEKLARFYSFPSPLIRTPKTKEQLEKMLMTSVEQPFQNITIFKKIANHVIPDYDMHRNKEIILLVLRRGKHFIEEDEQTKKEIEQLLEQSGYNNPKPQQ